MLSLFVATLGRRSAQTLAAHGLRRPFPQTRTCGMSFGRSPHLTKVKETRSPFPQPLRMIKGLNLCLLWLCITLVAAHGALATGGGDRTGGLIPMVLCAGDESETVWIDANGNPVDPARHCIQCKHCLGGMDLAHASNATAPGLTPYHLVPVNWSVPDQSGQSSQIRIPMPRAPPGPSDVTCRPEAPGDAAMLQAHQTMLPRGARLSLVLIGGEPGQEPR
ncbi:hypothetical protein PVW48_14360 [Dinoroseobacter sp. PD6]|uniref:hypothetical protein n=1 Tax=Dinoroseobacter sp. PD6 TaxID=3028384 RepID=UPI00237AF46F|nr:hypothetical protein [Dinoroseobacter sp. PD6]MDD9717939.1 hypothetical protein [Dinoroseobacter sp. PD6]